METLPIVQEVKAFLAGLKSEFPEVFRPVPAPPALPPDRRTVRFEGGLIPLPAAEDLENWYRARALEAVTRQAEAWSVRMGVRYNRVFIKDQRTLWGSCSREGNLNFNWRLILAPPAVLEYVVIHELAHLVEMNHSRRFWRIVADFCPSFKTHRRWLKDNDIELRPRRPYA